MRPPTNDGHSHEKVAVVDPSSPTALILHFGRGLLKPSRFLSRTSIPFSCASIVGLWFFARFLKDG